MKKFILSAAVVMAFAGLSCFATSARAQGGAGASSTPKIGLIDMAEVFKEYKKFEALREGLKTDIQATDAKAKQMAAQAQSLQQKLKSGTFKPDSPQYQQIETQLQGLQLEFTSFKNKSQREFMKKESQIYKTVYLEVSDAVAKYAGYYKYTLVLRYNRKSLEEADNPQGVLQSMNKQVIFMQSDDDITDPIIDYLNRLYIKNGGNTADRSPSRRNN